MGLLNLEAMPGATNAGSNEDPTSGNKGTEQKNVHPMKHDLAMKMRKPNKKKL
jgi:hypothetical protein